MPIQKRDDTVQWTIFQKFISLSTENKTYNKTSYLFLKDFYHQNINKYVTWGLKSQKYYVGFPCNPMESVISGVHP